MLYLKTFEGLLYGEHFFGKNVFEYFPWYSYPKRIDELPKLNNEYWEFYKSALTTTVFEPLTLLWNPEFRTWIEVPTFGVNSYIQIIPQEEIVTIDGSKKLSVDEWGDIEKIRLMQTIGTKKRAAEYLKILDDIDFFYDFYLYEIENGTPKKEIGLASFKPFLRRLIGNKTVDSSKSIKTTDEDVIEFITNYSSTGNNRSDSFFFSLQKWLSDKGSLTPKQIEAARPTTALNKLSKVDTTCMWIEDGNPNSPSVKRMKSGGCKMIEINGYLILWRD